MLKYTILLEELTLFWDSPRITLTQPIRLSVAFVGSVDQYQKYRLTFGLLGQQFCDMAKPPLKLKVCTI